MKDEDASIRRRLSAILAADIAGYSRLMGQDEAGTVRDLKGHQAEILPLVGRHGGRIIDTAGDGILAEFPSVIRATECAMQIQAVMAARNEDVPEHRRMLFRIGINLGDVIHDEARIYGDGINVAARLEGLADAGGVLISRAVHDQVRDRLDLAFEDLGEQALKNIARPVHVYRIRTLAEPRTAAARSDALPLPDKPSIAVLPFTNMSGDPEQEYFTDGITEDIITELSRFSSLFVIARNSSFTYKGKGVDVKEIGRQLGVRYVLEGSIRRAANRIRVTGQLIDSLTGSHIWAERFDRVLEDVFEVQEEVTRAIVVAIAPQIENAEVAKTYRLRPGNLGAYELALRAWADAREAYNTSDATLRDRAITTARQALALDSRCGLALVTVCFAQWQHILYGTSPSTDSALADGLAAGTRALEIDPSNHQAFTMRGMLQYRTGQRRAGLEDLRRAHQLNPNDATALFCLGFFEATFGDALKGIEYGTRAVRLSPRDYWRATMHQNLATSYFLARQYEAGMQAALTAVREAPVNGPAYTALALNLVGLGKVDEGVAAAETWRRVAPSHFEARLRGGYQMERPDDEHRTMTFLRIAAGLEDRSAADALR